ncbi:MAG: hypothetical protein ABSC53_00685 [Bacteroidota bacterium]
MQTYDQLPKLEPNPYLFTRLQAILTSKQAPGFIHMLKNIDLKPLVLSIIIILNILSAVYVFAEKEKSLKDQLVFSLSQDYNSTQNDTLLEN